MKRPYCLNQEVECFLRDDELKNTYCHICGALLPAQNRISQFQNQLRNPNASEVGSDNLPYLGQPFDDSLDLPPLIAPLLITETHLLWISQKALYFFHKNPVALEGFQLHLDHAKPEDHFIYLSPYFYHFREGRGVVYRLTADDLFSDDYPRVVEAPASLPAPWAKPLAMTRQQNNHYSKMVCFPFVNAFYLVDETLRAHSIPYEGSLQVFSPVPISENCIFVSAITPTAEAVGTCWSPWTEKLSLAWEPLSNQENQSGLIGPPFGFADKIGMEFWSEGQRQVLFFHSADQQLILDEVCLLEEVSEKTWKSPQTPTVEDYRWRYPFKPEKQLLLPSLQNTPGSEHQLFLINEQFEVTETRLPLPNYTNAFSWGNYLCWLDKDSGMLHAFDCQRRQPPLIQDIGLDPNTSLIDLPENQPHPRPLLVDFHDNYRIFLAAQYNRYFGVIQLKVSK